MPPWLGRGESGITKGEGGGLRRMLSTAVELKDAGRNAGEDDSSSENLHAVVSLENELDAESVHKSSYGVAKKCKPKHGNKGGAGSRRNPIVAKHTRK